MTGDEAVVAVIDALESAGIAYMLVGSLATNFYGVLRGTEDADSVKSAASFRRIPQASLSGRSALRHRLATARREIRQRTAAIPQLAA